MKHQVMSLKVQITRLNDSAIPAPSLVLHQTYNTFLKDFFFPCRPTAAPVSFRFFSLRPSNGFFNPFHNIGLPGGLCGPYVDPISSHSSAFILRDFLFFPPLVPSSSSICLGKMLVILRDGRKLHGVLRSYDQFGK